MAETHTTARAHGQPRSLTTRLAGDGLRAARLGVMLDIRAAQAKYLSYDVDQGGKTDGKLPGQYYNDPDR